MRGAKPGNQRGTGRATGSPHVTRAPGGNPTTRNDRAPPTLPPNGQRASGGSPLTRGDVTTLMNNRDATLTEARERLRQEISADYTSKISDIIDSLEFTQRELVDMKNNFERMKAQNSQLQNQLENVSQELTTLKQHFNKAELRADYMEDQSRRNNLRICGVPEEPNENWEQTQRKVARLFYEKFNATPDLERVHRVGKNKNKTRDIVAKFFRFQDRDAVYMDRRKLKGTQIYINEDLCPATVEVRRQQKDALLEARQQGKVAYFNYRTLVVRDPRPTERATRHQRHATAQPGASQASLTPRRRPTSPHTPPRRSPSLQRTPPTHPPPAMPPLNEAAWPGIAATSSTNATSPTTQTSSNAPVHVSPVTTTAIISPATTTADNTHVTTTAVTSPATTTTIISPVTTTAVTSPVTTRAVGTDDSYSSSHQAHSVVPTDDTTTLASDGAAYEDSSSPTGRGARSRKQPSYYKA